MVESLDHPLPWPARTRLRIHLFVCDACRAFRAQMVWLALAMRRLDDR